MRRRTDVNKALIATVRAELGPGCSMTDVAAALGVSVPTIQRRLTRDEMHQWAMLFRQTRRDGVLDRAIRKLKIRRRALGRLPTARESRIHTTVLTKCGGFNAIVAAAGYTPAHPYTPRDRRPTAQG